MRDELMAALPHLRRLPDRIDRILTLTGRGDLRIRSVVDEDRADPADVGEPGAARRGRRGVPGRPRRSCSSRTDPGRPSARTACSRSSATADCSPARCCSCGSSRQSHGTGRHDRVLSDAGPGSRRTARRLRRRSTPPGERYFRHPGDVVRLVLWGRPRSCSVVSSRSATATSEGVTTDLGPGRPRLPARCGSSCSRLLQSWPRRPARHRGRAGLTAAVAPAGSGRLAGAAGAGLFALLDAGLSTSAGGSRTRSRRHVGALHSLPVARVRRRRRRRRDVGKPWLSRSWRRSWRLAACSCSSS